MADRAVLGELPTGEIALRVSKPGSNVLNMNLPGSSVAFDSRWIGAGRLYKKGVLTVGGPGSTGTVSFGETLPVTPVVIAFLRSTTGNTTTYWQVEAASDIRRELTDTSGSAVNDALRPEVRPSIDVRRNQVIFRNNTTVFTDGMVVYYIVMRL